MQNSKNKKKKISKSFGNSNISMFINFLKYKCKGKIIKIDESYTTQINCLTNKLFEQKIELNQREVQLTDNIIIDRDLNSAINIFKIFEKQNFASMTKPLSTLNVLNVVEKNNLFNKPETTLL